MANRIRGEISASFDGKTYTLCLTLGALAELESLLGEADMLALAKRFESGRMASRDAVAILGAGLRGAGYDITDDEVAAMRCEGAAAGFVTVVARLLEATFGEAADAGAEPPGHPPKKATAAGPASERPDGADGKDGDPIPFPGHG